MRALQKLHRNGSSTIVTIARPILMALDWLPGQTVICEVTADKSLCVRLPTPADLSPLKPGRFMLDTEPAVKA